MYMNRKEKALIITIGANLVLIALKFILAWVSGSLALKAGAWHSFSDIFVSGIVLTGLIIARKEDLKPSKGISRIENTVSIIVSLFILYIGYEIFREVIKGDARALSQVPVVILGALLTIAISYFMARYKIYVGKETNSPSLIADGYHSKMDMYSSVVVVIGLTGYLIGLVNMDKVAAVIIVILIVWAGLEIFAGALKALRTGGLPEMAHGHKLLDTIGKMSPWVRTFGLPLLLAVYFASGTYYIRWDQTGIEKRFGKPIDINVSPGLHYRFPWPVGQIDKINTSTVRTAESDPALMLTGDENLIRINITAHYAVKDAFNFSYRVTEPQKLVKFAAESAVRQIISQETVDYILTAGKSNIQNQTLELAQGELDKEQAGIRLINVQILQADPPREVMGAFRDVASAKEDKVTYLNEAYAYQNEVVPVSRGRAAEIVAEAEGYRSQKVNRSRGEAGGFLDRLKAYQQSQKITQARMYIETLEKILPGVDKLIVDSRVDIESIDLWMLKGKTAGKLLTEVNKK
ncbi:MAG: FtsH protease activity modulator HflK [Actinobacteria bacterium]|nr:FtsH protease activity modulator HflK [Actinomycetota bacterium]